MRDYHAHFEYENYYHVYNRGNNGENLFCSNDNCEFFLSKWAKYIDPFADTFAYCLMPNHFHLLIKIYPQNCFAKSPEINKTESGDVNQFFEKQFKNLFSSYSLAFNKQQNRHGSLFEKRFKRINIDSDNYLSQIIHYIHNNPIHHGFRKDYKSWKFSSYRSIISDQPTRINRKEVLEWFGGKQAFIDFHRIQINYDEIKGLAIDL